MHPISTLRAFLLATLFLAFTSTVPGCALLPVIAKILPYITQTQNVVDAIESVTEAAFRRLPNPELEHIVQVAIAKTRQGIDTMNAAGQTADSLDDKDLQAARDNCIELLEALIALTQPLGVRVQPPGALMAFEGDVLLVPTPETLLAFEGS